MNIALCFCVRNCEEYIPNILKNIELVKTLNIKVFCIFVYDNCSDNSGILLKNYQKKYSKTVILKTIINNSRFRTERIAKARNECLNILYNNLKDISFHIMVDCDTRCASKWDVSIIEKYLNNFDNDDWDCISFNRNDYYDIWALLYDDFRHPCWGFGDNSLKVWNIMKNIIVDKLNNSHTNSIEVISAFNGFCIYKTDKFKGLRYKGNYLDIGNLITPEENRNTVTALKKYNINTNLYCYTPWKTLECCEHIYYHLNAHKKGLKIKISKFHIID